MTECERTLPHSSWERWELGLASFFFAILFGSTALGMLLTPMPSLGIFFTFVILIIEELLLVTTLVSVLGVIWALATPRWVEKLYRSAWKKLFVVIFLGIIPIVILIGLAIFGLKIGDGLNP